MVLMVASDVKLSISAIFTLGASFKVKPAFAGVPDHPSLVGGGGEKRPQPASRKNTPDCTASTRPHCTSHKVNAAILAHGAKLNASGAETPPAVRDKKHAIYGNNFPVIAIHNCKCVP